MISRINDPLRPPGGGGLPPPLHADPPCWVREGARRPEGRLQLAVLLRQPALLRGHRLRCENDCPRYAAQERRQGPRARGPARPPAPCSWPRARDGELAQADRYDAALEGGTHDGSRRRAAHQDRVLAT